MTTSREPSGEDYFSFADELRTQLGRTWSVVVEEAEGARVLIRTAHPLSRGHDFLFSAKPLDELRTAAFRLLRDSTDLQADVQAVREIDEIGGIEHPEVLAKARSLAQTYRWSAKDVHGLGWFLFEIGALSEWEAEWLARHPGVG